MRGRHGEDRQDRDRRFGLGRRSTWRAAVAATALLLGVLAATSVAADEPGAPLADMERIQAGLDAVHAGRLELAERRFRELERARPESAAGSFFLAYVAWWRIFSDASPAVASFTEHVEEALARSRSALKADGSAEAHFYNGLAHLFRAHVRAQQKHYFGAALDGKSARKQLLRARRDEPRLVDALFGLGLYNYYADHVPTIVKGLRALLFLPGGDAEEGLDQLRRVAEEGLLFRTESHMVLAVLYRDDQERRLCDALAALRGAGRLRPDSPAVQLSLADLLSRLGRPHDARPLAESARAVYDALGDEAEPLARQSARLLAARIAYETHDVATAGALVADARDRSVWIDDALRRRAVQLLATVHALNGHREALAELRAATEVALDERPGFLQWGPPPDVAPGDVLRLAAALVVDPEGDAPSVATRLRELVRADDASPALVVEAARAAWQRGLWETLAAAVAALDARGAALSPERQGWLATWRGQLADLAGHRDRAVAAYRRAYDTGGFRADELAHFLEEHPFTAPLCGAQPAAAVAP